MHPLQSAIAKLHENAEALHTATKHVEFTGEKDTAWAILVSMMPDIIEATQELAIAAFQFFTAR